jgi:ABC-type sugar transport system substrate-binding protein
MSETIQKVEKVLLALITEDSTYQLAQLGAARAVELSARLEVVPVFAGGSLFEQINQLFAATHDSGIRAMFIEAVDPTPAFIKVMRIVLGRGVSIGLLNIAPDCLGELREEFDAVTVFAFMKSQEGIGRLHARQAHKALPDGGSILYVTGSKENARAAAFHAALIPNRYDVHEVCADWSREGAKKEIHAWAKTSSSQKIDLVVCQNDSMAWGVLDSGIPCGIGIIGCDGDGVGKQLVDEKKLLATIIVPTTAGSAIKAWVESRDKHIQPPLVIEVNSQPYPSYSV